MGKMMRLLHLDAGRKFFGVPALKSILDTMSSTGFTHLELYFSDNQGFRFALDDMVIHTAWGSYDLTPCLGDGYCEGPKSPSGCGGYLTTADMEEIFSYAKDRGIGLVPLLNMPGHMGCILDHFPHLRYPNSRSSIDLQNEEAVVFTLALLEKYVAWFKKLGCRYFHFGADEWGNDIAPGYPDEIIMGIDHIHHDGTISCLNRFINRCAEVILAAGMTPMAFNDGIYYAGDDQNHGAIDNRILVTYWSKGWNGYDLARADWLEEKGFGMINANRLLYCGTGRKDWSPCIRASENFDPYIFDPETRVKAPVGAMLCYWSDRGNADGMDGGAAAARHLIPVMEAFGRSMDRRE